MFYPQKLSGSMLVVLAQPLPTSGEMELTLLVLIIIGMVPTIQEVILDKLGMSVSTVLTHGAFSICPEMPMSGRTTGMPNIVVGI